MMAAAANKRSEKLKRRRHRETESVSLMYGPGGTDGHTHCATLDGRGVGRTSPGPDGHVHRVRWFVTQAARANDAHTHDLSGSRCPRRHDEEGRHVEAR
jgi:hypothetical protein